MLLNSMHFSHIVTLVAARPIAQQAQLKLLVYTLTTFAFFLQIIGRLANHPPNHLSKFWILKLAIKPLFLIIKILINLIKHLSQILRKLIPMLIYFPLQGQIRKIVSYQQLKLVTMIMKNVCQLVIGFQLIVGTKSEVLHLFVGKFQQVEDKFEDWELVSEEIRVVYYRINR